MIIPQIPTNEKKRLEALYSYYILDSNTEVEFDKLCNLAAEICDASNAFISLIDKERQWFKSHINFDASELPRSESFCGHAILTPQDLLVIEDARKDKRFQENPNVTRVEKPVIFYAGVPLLSTDKLPLGTLCVVDHKPKKLADFQIRALKTLAKQVEQLLELRKAKIEIERNHFTLKSQVQKLDTYQKALDEAVIFAITDFEGRFTHLNENFTMISQYSSEELIGKTFEEIDSTYKQNEYWQNVKNELKANKSWKGRLKLKNKSGESYWVKSTIVPFTDEVTGKITEFIHIQNDISDMVKKEQKRINSVIHEQEKFNKNISHNLREGVAQSIAGLSFQLNAIENQMANNEQIEKINTKELRENINNLLKETQSLAFHIMPGTLIKEGIAESLYSYFNHIQENPSVDVNFQLDLQNKSKIEKGIEIQVYRTIVDLFETCLERSQIMNADLLLLQNDQGVGIELSIFQNEIKDSEKAKQIKELVLFIEKKVKIIDGEIKYKSNNQWRNFQLSIQLPNRFLVCENVL